MEYLNGVPLTEVLSRRRLSLHEAVRVFKGILAGLQAAHEQDLFHHALAPEHILVSEDLALVKASDFGLGRCREGGPTTGTVLTRTQVGGIASLHYMSPEEAEDPETAGATGNIYSAGVIFYEMLTGRVPGGRVALPSSRNPEVPFEIDALVLKCLAKNPADRYSSVADLRRSLTALEDQLRLGILNELHGFSRSTSKLLGAGREGERKVSRVFLGVVAIVALVAILIAAFFVLREDWPGAAPEEDAEEAGVSAAGPSR